jgi:hypothetical protein
MATAPGDQYDRRGPRPATRLALGLVLVLLVIAACGGVVALTLAADDHRAPVAPWAKRGAPDVKPQPLEEQ